VLSLVWITSVPATFANLRGVGLSITADFQEYTPAKQVLLGATHNQTYGTLSHNDHGDGGTGADVGAVVSRAIVEEQDQFMMAFVRVARPSGETISLVGSFGLPVLLS
jgi:hypothetical protein